MSTGSPAASTEAAAAGRHYLRQFDLFRVITFLCVIAQHSVLWPVPGGSKVGWSLVMVLHATRNAFFFLAAFVATYSELFEHRSVLRLWFRRIGLVLVPYLAWTFIYFFYTLATTHGPLSAKATLGDDLWHGYYQLYWLVVVFQVYIVLPGVIWLVRRTQGHHAVVFAVSLAVQLAMMTISHYFSWHTGGLHTLRSVDLTLIQSRLVTGYQLYVISGALAADHFSELQGIVERHSARILWCVGLLGAATEGYYALGLTLGQAPGHASDLYQPVAVIWFLAACAGLWAIGWRWARRATARSQSWRDRLVTWAADASGGYYLAHVLVLEIIFSVLANAGLTGKATWGYASLVIYVGTVLVTGLGVGILLRTPLRWVLTGPVRSAERAKMPSYPEQEGSLAAAIPAAAGVFAT